jgi:heparanase 1
MTNLRKILAAFAHRFGRDCVSSTIDAVRALAILAAFSTVAGCHGCESDDRVHIAVDGKQVAATVSDRFLSVSIDTAQVVGGNFWTPGQTQNGGTSPVPPFDFARPRLRALAAPLGHAYLRIGGTDADRTYYALDGSIPTTAPSGYRWILSRAQLDAVMGFASALDFQILFTLDAGAGPRGGGGPWTPDNARALVRYATSKQAPVAVWELGNEINGYLVTLGFSLSVGDYAHDVQTARALLAADAPAAKLAGPASAYWPTVGEFVGFLPPFVQLDGTGVDVITWHYYPQQSARCPLALRPATPTLLLDPRNLDEIDRWADQVEHARATSAPNAQIWLDETSNAQCGGAPGISDAFASSLWWLDELGKMARRGTSVVVRQSLTGADYGLLAEPSLDPRPDYFATLLWRRLMGARSLSATVAQKTVRAYAHCAAGAKSGAVTVLVINLDAAKAVSLALDGVGMDTHDVYAVTADGLSAKTARLNGQPLVADADGNVPSLLPRSVVDNTLVLAPASYAFVVFPNAGAPACH